MVKSIDLRGSAKKSKNKISANSEKGVHRTKKVLTKVSRAKNKVSKLGVRREDRKVNQNLQQSKRLATVVVKVDKKMKKASPVLNEPVKRGAILAAEARTAANAAKKARKAAAMETDAQDRPAQVKTSLWDL
jgi:hypothetical protein